MRSGVREMMISCIVGVYNGAKFLRDAIDSIVAQSYSPVEVVVVDDGSTDGSAEIAASYGDKLRLIRQQNRGVAAARNTGIESASGELLAFLDADDIWTSEKLQLQFTRLETDPDLDYCLSHLQNFWEPELADEEERFRDHPRAQPIAAYSTVTLLAKRKLFEEVGLFDATLPHGECTDWFRRVKAAGGRGCVLEEVLTLRRLHANNRSRQYAERSRDHYLNYLKSILDQKSRR